MMGFGHRGAALVAVLGADLALSTAGVAQIPSEHVLAAALAAVPFSAGRFSPDADQTWLKGFGHRKGVHGWWVPAMVAAALASSPLAGVFLAWAPVLGWSSHLAADWVFGKGGRSIPKGLPVLPWCKTRTGLGWKVTGRWPGKRSGRELLVTLTLWTLVGFMGIDVVTLTLEKL